MVTFISYCPHSSTKQRKPNVAKSSVSFSLGIIYLEEKERVCVLLRTLIPVLDYSKIFTPSFCSQGGQIIFLSWMISKTVACTRHRSCGLMITEDATWLGQDWNSDPPAWLSPPVQLSCLGQLLRRPWEALGK